MHAQGTGPATFSDTARFMCRGYNELPHEVAHRMSVAHKPAANFLRQFPWPASSHIASLLSFFAKSLLAVILLLAVVDDDLILSTYFHGRNLMWYAAILTSVTTVTKTFQLPTRCPAPYTSLKKLLPVLKYYPDRWAPAIHLSPGMERDAALNFVNLEVSAMFQSRLLLFFGEIWSVCTMPYVLAFHVPRHTVHILRFLRANTYHIPTLGAVYHPAHTALIHNVENGDSHNSLKKSWRVSSKTDAGRTSYTIHEREIGLYTMFDDEKW